MTNNNFILHQEPITVTYRNESFTYMYLSYEDTNTGERFTTTKLDEVNVAQVYNQYRVKYGIPFPDEIRHIREQLGVSATMMSNILGFGDNQYRLYENGDMPSVSNGRTLRSIIRYPKTIKSFIEGAKLDLSEKKYNALLAKIDNCTENPEKSEFVKWIFGNNTRNEYNGYADQSLSVLKNVILYFIEKENGVYKTMMNKLLFYSDFLAYKRYGIGITGLSYQALQFGPVPVKWDRVYSAFDEINAECVLFDNGNAGEKLVSDMPYDKTVLTDEQVAILEQVYMTFRNDSARSVSEKSHEEMAWLENHDNQALIDYTYAFTLKHIS